VATLQALKARAAGELDNVRLWKLSGGEALSDVIERQIALGRGEDLDRVRALLDEIRAEAPTMEEPHGPEASHGKLPPEEAPAEPPSGRCRDELRRTLRLLQSEAEAMLAGIPENALPDYPGVLNTCLETIREVSNLLSEAAETDAAIADLLEDVQEGEDMLLLLELETGEEAAADAVSLLLQIKKEVSARACA
jgi:hypothetical protein